MQGSEFLNYLDHFPNFKKSFKGIFSIDRLPKSLKYRQFFIGNTDLASGPGIHWFLCLRSKKKCIELFDSLGIDSEKKSFYLKYLKFHNIVLEINSTQFQPNDSVSCGKFVIYFLIQRLFNLDISFKSCLKLSFTSDMQENDNHVNIFCDSILKI